MFNYIKGHFWALLILSVGISRVSLAELSCESLFNDRILHFQSLSTKLKFDDVNNAISSSQKTQSSLNFIADHGENIEIKTIDEKNITIQKQKLQKKMDSRGQINQGIYFLNDPKAPKILKLYDQPPATFLELLNGVLIGERWGAPKVYSFGSARFENSDHILYFVLMERVFPDEISYSIKTDSDFFMSLVNTNSLPLKQLAQNIIFLLSHNVVPVDPDLLITPDGRMRWIDADFWQITNTTFLKFDLIKNLILQFSRSNPKVALLFINYLNFEIENENYQGAEIAMFQSWLKENQDIFRRR